MNFVFVRRELYAAFVMAAEELKIVWLYMDCDGGLDRFCIKGENDAQVFFALGALTAAHHAQFNVNNLNKAD